MSHVRPMHPQQLPTTASAAWLMVAVMFVVFVVVPGALTLLSLLVGNIISYLMSAKTGGKACI